MRKVDGRFQALRDLSARDVIECQKQICRHFVQHPVWRIFLEATKQRNADPARVPIWTLDIFNTDVALVKMYLVHGDGQIPCWFNELMPVVDLLRQEERHPNPRSPEQVAMFADHPGRGRDGGGVRVTMGDDTVREICLDHFNRRCTRQRCNYAHANPHRGAWVAEHNVYCATSLAFRFDPQEGGRLPAPRVLFDAVSPRRNLFSCLGPFRRV